MLRRPVRTNAAVKASQVKDRIELDNSKDRNRAHRKRLIVKRTQSYCRHVCDFVAVLVPRSDHAALPALTPIHGVQGPCRFNCPRSSQRVSTDDSSLDGSFAVVALFASSVWSRKLSSSLGFASCWCLGCWPSLDRYSPGFSICCLSVRS